MDNKIKIDSIYKDIEDLTKKALRDLERLEDNNLSGKELKQLEHRIGLNLMFIEDLRIELIKLIEQDPNVKVAWVLNFEQMVQQINNKQNKGE